MFAARSDNVGALVALLAPLVLSKTTVATILLDESGLSVAVSQGSGLAARARLERTLFSEYASAEAESLSVNLSTLVSVLKVFGPHSLNSVSVRLAWRGYGSDVQLVVTEGAMRTECALRTLEADEPLDPGFRSDQVVTQLTLASDSLREAFGELDASAPYVTLEVSPNAAPHLRLSSAGVQGSASVEWSRLSPLFDSFLCRQAQRHVYRFANLSPCIKALSGASKTQIQISSTGVLLLQHLIKGSGGAAAAVVDFIFTPSLGPDDDDDPEPDNDFAANMDLQDD